MTIQRRKDGFLGEKIISIPESILTKAIKSNNFLASLYLTHIGYFPNALYHYRNRRNGCSDNILLYCIRGKGWYSVNNTNYTLNVNQYCIIPATKEKVQYGSFDNDPWTIYWIHFSGENIAAFNNCYNIDDNIGPRNIPYNEKAIHLWEYMYNNLSMGFSIDHLSFVNLSIHAFIASFLYPDNLHPPSDEKDLINSTILFMKNNISKRLSILYLSSLHNISTSHFSFIFKKNTGIAPMDYFIHLKLQRASLLLQTTNKKIKTVASEIGYDDTYYFSRLFKKYMNASPEVFRKSCRV